MGLFYSALQRADKQAAEPDAPASVPASMAAEPAPVTDWQQAEDRDLAGFPLLPATEAQQVPPAAGVLNVAVLGLVANEEGVANEQYRILRTRIFDGLRNVGRRSLLVTSALAGEGKTLVAANLAVKCSALKQERILLVDADMRRAGLSACLQPVAERGLRQYLLQQIEWAEALYEINPWLSVLPTQVDTQAAELLATQRMATLLQEAQQRYDLILIDGAPVAPVADSRILARLVGASLLIVRSESTPTAAVRKAAELLHPTLLGSVLNGARRLPNAQYGYGYGNGRRASAKTRVVEAKS